MDNHEHAAIQAAIDSLDNLIDVSRSQSPIEKAYRNNLTAIRDDLQRLINPAPTRLRLGNPDWSRYGCHEPSTDD